ncbi:ribosomal RNA processing 1 homolog [Olea europaea subsp. europaea]|uniref:Ribosomal RNA processing 1 homolog n=1 Tax=Olea europaea subsp. europaea TaxID=158383 RepID=A0A8S0VG87_OLEEU|nr:ribosomal RNA processing 1 homolog [Olea europaea subsp. europaea]
MKKRPREPKPLVPTLASCTGPSLIKHLASCNSTVRSQSLKLLQSWLTSQKQEIPEEDIKKLWKGLFYCFWHSDKAPNQLALVNRLTSLLLTLEFPVSLQYFSKFVLTLRREWPGIDRLRLDKFYLLIRRFVRTLFELMKLKQWDLELLRKFMGVLENYGFMADDKLQGNGVNYHIVSVFLEELKEVRFPVRKEVVDVIFGPFFAVLMKSKDRILVGKVTSSVFDELLKMGRELLAKKKTGVDCDKKDGDVSLAVVALKMCFSGRLYDVGSSAECFQGNRKVVFGLHEEFLKLEKDLESCGVEIVVPEFNEASGGIDFDDEVPHLIAIDYNTSNGVCASGTSEEAEDVHDDKNESDDESLKKSKRARKATVKSRKKLKGSDTSDKKSKRKKKDKEQNMVSESGSIVEENGNVVIANGMGNGDLMTAEGKGLDDELESGGTDLTLDESVISNLQKQFEKVAAEVRSHIDDDTDSCDTPTVTVKNRLSKKKRKVAKMDIENPDVSGQGDDRIDNAAKSVEKSAKKVRFSMKNNLVWKPHSPLPPESLRLPPSVTPRGSALKKGVPPGPIREMPPAKKKKKQKTGRQMFNSASPGKKQKKKIQTGSI